MFQIFFINPHYVSISVSVVEEELFDRHEGERMVKINLNSTSSVIQNDANVSNVRSTETPNFKSVLKMSTTTDSSTQVIGDRTRSVGFKLDKECQTDLSHEPPFKHTPSNTSQTSTDDEEITSRCSCLDNNHCENSEPQINCNGCVQESEHFKYIDSNEDDIPNSHHNNGFQRGFD